MSPPRGRAGAAAGRASAGRACTFCRVVAGELPADTVHSDGATVAFLDHRPVFPGHVLLVPRLHVGTLAELPLSQVDHFFRLAQRLEVAVEEAMGSDGSMILINNRVSQSVPHLHLHVIPRRFKDGLRFWLGPRHPYGSAAEAEQAAARIRDALDLTGVPDPGDEASVAGRPESGWPRYGG